MLPGSLLPSLKETTWDWGWYLWGVLFIHHVLLSSCVAILDREQVWAIFQLHPKTGIHSVSLRTLSSLHLLLQGMCVCVCACVCMGVCGKVGGLGTGGKCAMVPGNCNNILLLLPQICISVAMATMCWLLWCMNAWWLLSRSLDFYVPFKCLVFNGFFLVAVLCKLGSIRFKVLCSLLHEQETGLQCTSRTQSYSTAQ